MLGSVLWNGMGKKNCTEKCLGQFAGPEEVKSAADPLCRLQEQTVEIYEDRAGRGAALPQGKD